LDGSLTVPGTLILGGGIIGLACALELQKRGQAVTLIDREEPARGCSFGNAGIIATSEVFPIISAKRVIGLPKMLLDRDGPAVMRMAGFKDLLPWLLRASLTLTPERQRGISTALGSLNTAALPAWRALLNDIRGSALLRERGMIELMRAPASPEDLAGHCRSLNDMGLSTRPLSGDDVRELEPMIGETSTGGVLHENTAHVTDPFDVAMALLAAFQGRGGQIVLDEAITIEPRHNGHTVHGRSTSYVADTIVVAAGMASGALLRPLGATVPLQAERGYHLRLPLPTGWLNRPLTFHRESCVASPLTGGLRLAGTVEFASPDAAPDWSRADRLAQFAQRYFSKEIPLGGAERWMGSRPSLPDSLPAIGLHPIVPKLAYAFGHQHLGLTQAAVTAQHIANLLTARCSPTSLAEFDLSRFGFRAF